MKFPKIFLGVGAAMLLCAYGPAAFVINEIDPDTVNTATTDPGEFIELKGNPNEAATGLVLVYFNGGNSTQVSDPTYPRSYRTTDLNALVADANGYLVINTNNVIQNGEDAVAIYQALPTAFPTATKPTATGLMDFMIYENGSDPNADWSGFGPGPHTIYNENAYGQPAVRSLSRIPNGTGPFQPADLTPGAANSQSTAPSLSDGAFLRLNQTMATQGTTMAVSLRNIGTGPLTVNSITLNGGTDPAVTIEQLPSLPVTLGGNQTTDTILKLQDNSPATNRTYSGGISCTTDSSTTPTASAPISAELVRATQTSTSQSVTINEVCYNPSEDYNNDGAEVNQDDEFIELYNTTASPITIEGWEIRIEQAPINGSTKHSFVFPAGTTIAPNGFVVMFSQGNPTGFAPGTAFARSVGTAVVFNPGSLIEVNDAFTPIDRIAYLAAEDNPEADGYLNTGVSMTGGSIGRRPDGTNSFRTFAALDATFADRPSPGSTNQPSTAAHDWMLFQ